MDLLKRFLKSLCYQVVELTIFGIIVWVAFKVGPHLLPHILTLFDPTSYYIYTPPLPPVWHL